MSKIRFSEIKVREKSIFAYTEMGGRFSHSQYKLGVQFSKSFYYQLQDIEVFLIESQWSI